jgi:thioredoxin 1
MTMLSRRTTLIALGGIALAGPALAQASAPRVKFTPAAFDAAQKAGKPILVEITAPWCPTCRQQKPIINTLAARPEYAGVVIMEVDFDSQKRDLTTLKATSQSTLIAFKGTAETGRSVGETRAAEIEKLFKSAV